MSSIGEETNINKSIFTSGYLHFAIEEDYVVYFIGLLFTLKVERYCNPYSNNSNSYAEELM